MTHDEIQKRIDAECEALRAKLTAELLPPVEKAMWESLSRVRQGNGELFNIINGEFNGKLLSESGHGVANQPFAFRTKEQCDAVIDAFAVMIEMRRQAGSCVYGEYGVGCFSESSVGTFQDTNYPKRQNVLPKFKTQELAKQAIAAVGEKRIIAMFNTFDSEF